MTTSASLGTGAWVTVGAVALRTLGAYRSMRTEAGWTPGRDRGVQRIDLMSDGAARTTR
jgi:hypothetical protein